MASTEEQPNVKRARSLSHPGPMGRPHRPHTRRVHRNSLPSSTIPQFANIKNKRKYVRFSFREKKIICSVVAGNLFFGCIAGILVPFFPSEAEKRGVSQSLVGGVFAVYAFTQFAFAPMLSKLIPVMGASRVFHTGLAVTGVSTVVFGLLDFIPDADAFIVTCYVVRVVEALGTAAFVTAAYTIVANQFPENINLLVGTSETVCAVGIAAGPAIGGGLYTVGGYGLPFYVLGGVIVAATAISCVTLPWIGGDPQRVEVRRMSRRMIRSAEAWLNVVVLLLVAVAWTALDPGLAPYVTTTLGLSPAHLGLFFLLASGTYAVVGPVWGKLCDDLPNNYVQMSLCLVLAAVGLAIIPPAPGLGLEPSRSLVAVGMTMRELFLGGAFIPTFGNILRSGTAVGLSEGMGTQAFVSAIWCSAFSIGNTIGPLAAGLSDDAFGFPMTVTALSVITLLMAVPVAIQCLVRWRQLANAGASAPSQGPSERSPLLAESGAGGDWGERKGVNKYYPPDYDPSKGGLNKFQGTHALRERAKKIHLGILVIRFEMPYNIWCDGCGNHIGMGVRYNAEKSKVGMYYTTPVYQFRMKCHLCDNYFIIKTDPANLDYEVVSGARRQERRFDPGENGTVVPDERAKIQKLATDAMYKLEHGSDDVGKLRDAAPVLEHVERIQDRMWDDFAANKRLRDKFRAGKKAAAAVAARDADLLRRASLDLVLSPETDEDRRLAALMKLRDPVGLEERRKRKRAAIGARPALGTVAPRSGGFGTGRAAGTGGGRTAASIGVALGRSGGTSGSSPAAAAGDSERVPLFRSPLRTCRYRDPPVTIRRPQIV
ncbi:Coiled-coil domain-containing protein 130 [Amphibalanus amphitrite]|uniref:Coiled-coil domain-containing protein 130 n=1 Tax=Amphibalanus amphitrite TaxID=1232801 RepID=A0A6A4VRY8_AMPAM|nr:Coiled-coil domain-containing protein 130 [Amphibalanus amphitrite]